jgi:hypothetical protein
VNLFNLFKKKQPESQDEDHNLSSDNDMHACVSYFITSDGIPRVDIELRDYEEETVDNLCTLLLSLSLDTSFFETLGVVQEGLEKVGREDLFVEITSKIAISAAEHLASLKQKQNEEEKLKDDPCLSPSDML